MLRPGRERGAAAVEFALLLPLLMVMLLGIMEFGYAFFIQASAAGAARTGVRSYAINWNDDANGPTAVATAIALAKAALPDAGMVVDAATSFTPACATGSQTTLIVTIRYRSLTGLLDSIVGPNVTITGRGSMQCGG